MAIYRHDIHKMVWDVLASNPALEKDKVLDEFRKKGVLSEKEIDLYADCAACDACHKLPKKQIYKYFDTYCDACPLMWKDGKICSDDNGLHDQFVRARLKGDMEHAKTVAAQIRDLPLNPKTIKMYRVME